jgi:hypothetical protein
MDLTPKAIAAFFVGLKPRVAAFSVQRFVMVGAYGYEEGTHDEEVDSVIRRLLRYRRFCCLGWSDPATLIGRPGACPVAGR